MQRINILLRTLSIVGICGLAALALPASRPRGRRACLRGVRTARADGRRSGPGGGRPAADGRLPRATRLCPTRTRGRRTTPVMVQPRVMHGQPSYRGYASYGGYGRPWRHRHHDDGDHDEHGHYWRSNGWHG